MNFDMTDFAEDVISASHEMPVLVDFWAEWCAPCRALSPVLERLAERFKDQWKLVKINSDQYSDIASQYGVRGIPNVKLFIDGKVANEFTGALPENMILDWLKKAIPGKSDKNIKTAEDLLSHGKTDDAVSLLYDIIKNEPANEHAKVLLSKALFFTKPDESIKLLEGIDELSEYSETVNSIRTFARLIELSKDGKQLPDSAAKPVYLQAIEDIKNNDFDSALSRFIEVIRDDRYFDDDGARKACIAIFKYLGEDNETTIKHRRDFGSALYV